MSRSAICAPGRIADTVQDTLGLAEGLPHLGMQLVSADDVAKEYGVPSNGKNAYWRTYANHSMTAEQVKKRMLDSASRPIDGFNAAYVIRTGDPGAYEVALIPGEDGRLKMVCDLDGTGRGLGQRIMSKALLAETGGSLHGGEYPEQAFGRIAQAQKLGRTILDAREKGLEVEPVDASGDVPLFRIRKDAERAVAVTVNDVGETSLKAEGFRGEGCEAHLNELLGQLNLTEAEGQRLPEFALPELEEKVAVTLGAE